LQLPCQIAITTFNFIIKELNKIALVAQLMQGNRAPQPIALQSQSVAWQARHESGGFKRLNARLRCPVCVQCAPKQRSWRAGKMPLQPDRFFGGRKRK